MRLQKRKSLKEFFRLFSGSTHTSRTGRPDSKGTQASGRVDDLAFGVDSDLVLHAADAACLGDVPDLPQSFPVRLRCRFDLHLLEAVLAAMLARMRAGNSFSPLLSYLFQVSFRGSSGAGDLASCAAFPGTPARLTSSLRPPIAPITPAASAGRKIVVFFP